MEYININGVSYGTDSTICLNLAYNGVVFEEGGASVSYFQDMLADDLVIDGFIEYFILWI